MLRCNRQRIRLVVAGAWRSPQVLESDGAPRSARGVRAGEAGVGRHQCGVALQGERDVQPIEEPDAFTEGEGLPQRRESRDDQLLTEGSSSSACPDSSVETSPARSRRPIADRTSAGWCAGAHIASRSSIAATPLAALLPMTRSTKADASRTITRRTLRGRRP